MNSLAYADCPWLVQDRPRRTKAPTFRSGLRIATLAYTALFGIVLFDTRPALGPATDKRPVAVAAVHRNPAIEAPAPGVTRTPSHTRSAWLDPAPVGGIPRGFGDDAPLSAALASATPPRPSVVVADVEGDDDMAIPPPPAVASPLLADVPLPMPRPAALDAPMRVAGRDSAPAVHATVFAAGRPHDSAPAAAARPDNRSFFERFFGAQPAEHGQTLAYAAPEDGFFSGMRRAVGIPNAAAGYGPTTAVYEIASHTVYMPDGSQLEAHSGLRDRLDDPRYVQERMRGPTPPSTYDLKLRESLFHGVQALRLTPVNGNVFGRTGLLAHTYMLGPNGDSNGCVSFRNYKAFLQAFLDGDVKRLVVVARRY